MATSKLKTEELKNLYEKDKQTVEALKRRLNEALEKDPLASRKAALILQSWINQRPKK